MRGEKRHNFQKMKKMSYFFSKEVVFRGEKKVKKSRFFIQKRSTANPYRKRVFHCFFTVFCQKWKKFSPKHHFFFLYFFFKKHDVSCLFTVLFLPIFFPIFIKKGVIKISKRKKTRRTVFLLFFHKNQRCTTPFNKEKKWWKIMFFP